MYSWVISLVICVVALKLLISLAIRLELVDYPGGRKNHAQPVPLVGGVAMFIGFAFGLLTLPISLSEYRSFIAASALLIFVGVLDDLHEIAPRWRFLAQVLAGLLMAAWGGNTLHDLGNLLELGQPLALREWALPLTVFSVIGVINAMNMVDGIDGLAGSLAFITFCFLLYLGWRAGHVADINLIALLIAVTLGFLLFNFPWRGRGANVFMGDAGSMFLGFGLVWFLIALSQGRQAVARPVDMLWLIAVPLFDLVGVTLRRVMRRQSPFAADREHFHYLLLSMGFSPKAVVLLMSVLAIGFGVVGLLGAVYQLNESLLFGIFLSLFIIYFIGVHKAWQKLKQNN